MVDLNLAGMNGLDFIRAVRERVASGRVVMMSADAQPGRFRDAHAAGADAYLVQPIIRESFLAPLEALGFRRTDRAPPVLRVVS
jgi:DNA-binding NarL/FixJ family response regulator